MFLEANFLQLGNNFIDKTHIFPILGQIESTKISKNFQGLFKVLVSILKDFQNDPESKLTAKTIIEDLLNLIEIQLNDFDLKGFNKINF